MTNFRKKILIVLTRSPYPAIDGTRLRIFKNVLGAVKDRYECNVVILSDTYPAKESLHFLKDEYDEVHWFHLGKFVRFFRALLGWLKGYPLQVGYFFSQDAFLALQKYAKESDIIYLHTLRLGKYFENAPEEMQKKIVLDYNDAISLNYEEACRRARGFWRYIYAIEKNRIAKYEKKLLSLFRHFAIVSPIDRDYILKSSNLDPETIKIIPHGVPDDLLSTPNKYISNRNVVFLGNIFYPPNTDSVIWFSDFLKKQHMDLEYKVIGNFPENLSKRCPNAKFLGFVDDVSSVILDSSVFVSPLRFGAGIPTKILEAMALGMVVITTPIGARSITGAIDGVNIIIHEADDERGWREILDEIINDREKRMRIGNAARALVTERYTSSVAKREFLSLIEGV